MRKIASVLIVILMLASIVSGCNNPENADMVKIPNKNKVELDMLWEIQMDTQQSDYVIEGDNLYILTWNQSIYIVDMNTGEIKKDFKLNTEEIGVEEGRYSMGLAVDNGVLAINYVSKIVVVDTKTEEVLLKHQAVKDPFVAVDYHMLMKGDLLIFSHIIDKTIYAMDYRTGAIKWRLHDDRQSIFKLRKYEDKFFYTKTTDFVYYQFDPLTGKAIKEYQIESAGEIKNDKQSFFIPVVKGVKDYDLEIWLRNSSFDVFYLTNKGYIFTEYGRSFYFHGADGILRWEIEFPKEVYISYPYGRYAVLYFSEKHKKKSVAVLDFETKEIIWNIDYAISSKPRMLIHEEKLFLPGLDGSFKVFDLSNLEN